MKETLQMILSPEENGKPDLLHLAVASRMEVSPNRIFHIEVTKRSLDARKNPPKFMVDLTVWLDENPIATPEPQPALTPLSEKHKAIVVGSGPAGLFAALELLEMGIQPIVVERGKEVRERRRDLALLNREHIVDPDSNYCFGEGGAGTYSDGKLYTRSKKRGDVQQVLRRLVQHGAPQDILVNTHPHIGTNKLPAIITAIREFIIDAGGEFLFETRVTEILLEGKQLEGVRCHNGKEVLAQHLILATGHSARDIYELLHKQDIAIEFKPFALGVRIEHQQSIIDSAQYKCEERGEYLPPASYKLVQQVQGRGVYSFCMCPGGIIAPCSTAQEEVVTNGWSPSKRNNPFANSGIVVNVEERDIKAFADAGPLAGLRFQQAVERKAWIAGGKTQRVPAQRMIDFIQGRTSSTLPESSYLPGTTSHDLNTVLPGYIGKALREGLKQFGKKMRSYYTNEGLLHGVESRTSSPVRIPRDKATLEHIEISGLFPCGEGAGYAGGIVSAAIDGKRCARAIAEKMGLSDAIHTEA